MFAFHDVLGPVGVAFTDRAGGVSGGDFASLNLASRTDDDPDAVARNRRLVAEALTGSPDTPVALMRQVHGDVVAEVALPLTEVPEADALVTTATGVVLAVQVADCVPIVLADPLAGVVGAVHAGRNGVALEVVRRAVARLRELGGDELHAWLGPHVCGGCYEVPAAMRDEVAALVPAAHAETTWGTPSLDLGAAVLAQLADAGVDPGATHVVGRCTREDPELYSYRRDGARSGRLAGLVWCRP